MCQEINDLDVICQHKHDGSIIPLRIRIRDDEGQYQSYTIKAYKDLSHQGAYQMANGVFVTNRELSYLCQIAVFGKLRTIRLLYMPARNKWSIYF